MLSKFTCRKLKQGEELSELLANAMLILKLQRTRRLSRVASSDGFVRLVSCRFEPRGRFYNCVCAMQKVSVVCP